MRAGAAFAFAVAGAVGSAVRPPVRLATDTIDLRVPPDVVVAELRRRFSEGPDVVVLGEHQLVRRFEGKAGAFRYRTVELVRFEPAAVTFEHLRGPFARCEERFDLQPVATGTTLTHTGVFQLRGGLFTWPLAAGPVKYAFERHVRDHFERMAKEF